MEQTPRLKATALSFTHFVKGWHKGEGVPIAETVAQSLYTWIDIAEAHSTTAEVFPGIDGSAGCFFKLDSPRQHHYVIRVHVRTDGKYNVDITRWISGVDGHTKLVGGANLDFTDAHEMVTAWLDIARTGRADKPTPVVIF